MRWLSISKKFELIVSNPPWIIAAPISNDSFEDGNYDDGEAIITAIIEFAGKRLQWKGVSVKDGSLLLIYSDLSFNLGLSDKNLIEKLCKENSLKVKGSQELNRKEEYRIQSWK